MMSFRKPGTIYILSKFRIKARKYHNLSYLHNNGKESLLPLTIGKNLERAATNYGDRQAIISRSQKQSLTFREVLEQADKLAAGLRNIGLNTGDRVGIWAPNVTEWYLTHMACARGGFVLVNINPAYQLREIKYCINKVGVKSLISTYKFKTQNYYDILNSISPEISQSDPGRLKCKEMPTLESIIISCDESLKGAFNYEEIFSLATSNSIKNIHSLQDSISPDDFCHVQFTSGTTGDPKAPVQTHFQLVNNSYSAGKRFEFHKKHHKICVQVPFFHVFGTDMAINAALNHGATLVLPAPGYDTQKSLDAIRDEKCTVVYGTPTMYVDLVNTQKNRKEDISPEIAVCGGSPCSPHLFRQMKEILNLKTVKSIYGLSETVAVAFCSRPDDDEYHSTSTVGYLQDHLEAKVVDTEGKMVPRGMPGELLIRGYCNTPMYWGDEKKTSELVGIDGWLKTGDQFVLEEDGYGKIIGRFKELIIRGGENIVPREIEDLLNTHPDILETQVIGVPHERLGEEVCACIRVQEGVSVTLESIKSFCKGKISHFKIPSKLNIVESFPKTASGKIQKFLLVKAVTSEK